MTYVVTERCVNCRYTDCAGECPVEDCFYEIKDPAMLIINPDECIDCAQCVPACPVLAIWPEAEVPEVYEKWTEFNAEHWEEGEPVNECTKALDGARSLDAIKEWEAEQGWEVEDPSEA